MAEAKTRVFRLVHINNLDVYLRRQAIHAPNTAPADGLAWRAIHQPEVQAKRSRIRVPVAPGGGLHDYVPFYFGRRGPMLLQLHTGQVEGYEDGQRPILYLVAHAEEIAAAGFRFVFYDGHALARFSTPHTDLAQLDQLDWDAINAEWWNDTT